MPPDQIFLASRYLLSLVLLLVRATLTELLHTAARPDVETVDGGAETTAPAAVTNITENKLCEVTDETTARPGLLLYRTEAENYAVQHQVIHNSYLILWAGKWGVLYSLMQIDLGISFLK